MIRGGAGSGARDACCFLAGYLTLPAAQEAPLILLGQPGSGKSVLTRILAARLPAADFLPVRVELRQVPAEADLQARSSSPSVTPPGKASHGRAWWNPVTARCRW